MAAKKDRQLPDINTEEKIKVAARLLFHKKGFAGTRTRDIAEQAGINLALLNYYFRSKKKLFELIMLETLSGFLQNMGIVFNDESSTLEEKVQRTAEKYIDLLMAQPEIPVFIMSEIRSNGAAVFEKLPTIHMIMQSALIHQYREAADKGRISEPNPLHFIMNLMGLIVFPFMGSPVLKKVGRINDKQFNQLMLERKRRIPIWIKAMLKAK
jgi:AcrR family transcriptional regulator